MTKNIEETVSSRLTHITIFIYMSQNILKYMNTTWNDKNYTQFEKNVFKNTEQLQLFVYIFPDLLGLAYDHLGLLFKLYSVVKPEISTDDQAKETADIINKLINNLNVIIEEIQQVKSYCEE